MIGVFMTCNVGPAAAVAQGEGSETFAELAFDTSDSFLGRAGTIVNPEGKGDVLIFPYYDVRNIGTKTQETYFAIINHSPFPGDLSEACKDSSSSHYGIAAKLRFREWDKSEEPFDADIWLSCNDVWIGVLVRNTSTGVTRITSPDWVISDFSDTQFTVTKALASGQDFFTTIVPGGSGNTKTPPTGFTAADLTNMGYFEVIGEERTFSKQSGGKVTRVTTECSDCYADCPNVLSGYAYIVRVQDGVSVGYNATAIANFATFDSTLFSGPGAPTPDLASGDDGLEQLEFALSKANISHGYSIESSISAKFSMIITFPTKHFHFQSRPRYSLNTSLSISRPFTGTTANTGELVQVKIFDREEGLFTPTESIFSPKVEIELVVPHEVTIAGFYKSGSVPTLPAIGQRDTIAFETGTFDSGWVWINLTGDGSEVTHFAEPIDGFDFFGYDFLEYDGLPVIALALQEFSNTAIAGFYGDLFPTYYDVDWVIDPSNLE